MTRVRKVKAFTLALLLLGCGPAATSRDVGGTAIGMWTVNTDYGGWTAGEQAWLIEAATIQLSSLGQIYPAHSSQIVPRTFVFVRDNAQLHALSQTLRSPIPPSPAAPPLGVPVTNFHAGYWHSYEYFVNRLNGSETIYLTVDDKLSGDGMLDAYHHSVVGDDYGHVDILWPQLQLVAFNVTLSIRAQR